MTTSCRRLQAVGSTTNDTRPLVDTGCDVNDDIRNCGRLLGDNRRDHMLEGHGISHEVRWYEGHI